MASIEQKIKTLQDYSACDVILPLTITRSAQLIISRYQTPSSKSRSFQKALHHELAISPISVSLQ